LRQGCRLMGKWKKKGVGGCLWMGEADCHGQAAELVLAWCCWKALRRWSMPATVASRPERLVASE
jgi:hypothetical protein